MSSYFMCSGSEHTEHTAKRHKLMEQERKLVKACEQIILLNDRIRNITKRYEEAKNANYRSFRYSHRVKLAVIEGVRNVFYEYARDTAEDIADLRRELFNQSIHIITDDTDDYSDGDDEDIPELEDMESEIEDY